MLPLSYGGKIIFGKLRVRNIGKGIARDFRVAIYLSDDGKTLGRLIKTQSILWLKVGDTRDLSFLHFSRASLPGKYIIGVIDSSNEVAETDENNNRAVVRIR